MAIHLCRGNNRGHWYAEGGYDAIAEELFNALEVDRFLLEYDDERSGTFEPLRFVPRGKMVVLGLISSKRPKLEEKSALIRRIKEASRHVPLENLALSPQCGFASTAEGNPVSEDDQWAKLKLGVETAREVWRSRAVFAADRSVTLSLFPHRSSRDTPYCPMLPGRFLKDLSHLLRSSDRASEPDSIARHCPQLISLDITGLQGHNRPYDYC